MRELGMGVCMCVRIGCVQASYVLLYHSILRLPISDFIGYGRATYVLVYHYFRNGVKHGQGVEKDRRHEGCRA